MRKKIVGSQKSFFKFQGIMPTNNFLPPGGSTSSNDWLLHIKGVFVRTCIPFIFPIVLHYPYIKGKCKPNSRADCCVRSMLITQYLPIALN